MAALRFAMPKAQLYWEQASNKKKRIIIKKNEQLRLETMILIEHMIRYGISSIRFVYGLWGR
jgi:hypothetical protein